VLHLHASIPSPSAALAPLFWPPAHLPRLFSLLPELPPSDSSPSPWQMPESPPFPRPLIVTASSSGSSPSHSSRFLLPRTHRVPNTTAATISNSGDLLLAVGNPFPYTPHHYNPPRKLPLVSLTLPSHPPWPDLHRSYLAVDSLLAGKLLSSSSLYLRPSFVQSDHPNSFSSSRCSCQA
jgi:hypothetical protein